MLRLLPSYEKFSTRAGPVFGKAAVFLVDTLVIAAVIGGLVSFCSPMW